VIGSTSRQADDTLGTFTSSEMYPDNSTLCNRWVTIGLFEYENLPAVNTTFAQTLEAVAERVAPMIDLDYESNQPIGSQITYSIADWLHYKKILPHAPIYGVSVVGYSFRRIIAFSPDEIYVDIHPSYQQGAIDHTNPIHWKDMEFERHQLSFDRLMYLISATVYRIEHLYELAPIQVPGRTAPNAHLAQRLLMPVRLGVFHSEIYGHRDSTLRLGTAETAASKIKRKDEGGNGEITDVEATSSTRLTASDSTGPVGTSSTSSGSHGSLALNDSSLWSMTKEQLTFDWLSTEEQPAFDDAELSQYQNHLLTIAKPLASMSIQHQLQLFDFVRGRSCASARDGGGLYQVLDHEVLAG
jgi:hypothetical protein